MPCIFIILGKRATPDYSANLALLKLERLDDRRDKLSKKFAKRMIKHPEHSKMFNWTGRTNSRSGAKVIVPHAKTERYARSTIPSLARIINNF